MKKILLPLLLVAPLAAQSFEVGLNVSQQQYPSHTELGAFRVEPQDKTVVAARFGYAIVDLGPALFQVTAAYQPKVDTEVKVNGSSAGMEKMGQEYWGLGAMFNFKALVAVGAGVEYRSEKIDQRRDQHHLWAPLGPRQCRLRLPHPPGETIHRARGGRAPHQEGLQRLPRGRGCHEVLRAQVPGRPLRRRPLLIPSHPRKRGTRCGCLFFSLPL